MTPAGSFNMVENSSLVTRINDTVTHQVNKTPEIVEEVVWLKLYQRHEKKDFPSASINCPFPPINTDSNGRNSDEQF